MVSQVSNGVLCHDAYHLQRCRLAWWCDKQSLRRDACGKIFPRNTVIYTQTDGSKSSRVCETDLLTVDSHLTMQTSFSDLEYAVKSMHIAHQDGKHDAPDQGGLLLAASNIFIPESFSCQDSYGQTGKATVQLYAKRMRHNNPSLVGG